MAEFKNDLMHVYASYEQSNALSSIADYVPYIHEHIAPIVNVADKIQGVRGNINLLPVPGSEDGCWQTSICVDGQTHIFHTEEDCGYTVINVPNQQTEHLGKYHFLFMLKPKCYVGIAFVFSGLLLTHRQHCEMNKQCDMSFFNFASYANKKIFSHIKCSLLRNNE